jgi:hypothetical protein
MNGKRIIPSLERCPRLLAAILLVGAAAWAGGIKLRVTAEQANIRERPDIMSAILQQLPEGATIEAERKEGEWYALLVAKEGGGSVIGYVHESLVAVIDEAAQTPPQREDRPLEKPPVQPEPPVEMEVPPRNASPELKTSPEKEDRPSAAIWLGGRHAAVGDLNDGAQGLARYYESRLGASAGSEVEAVHFGYLVGAEVRVPLAYGFSFALGAEHTSEEKASSFVFAGGSTEASYSAKPGFSLTTVSTALLYYPQRIFYIRAGLDYSFGRASYFYRTSHPIPGQADEFWQEWTGRASSGGFGWQLGLGLEWPLGRRLAVVAEAAFRGGRLSGLKGEDLYRDSTGTESREKGTLYHVWATAGGTEVFPLVFVRNREPAEAGIVDSRKAEFNLTGYSLRVGLQVRF